ncbi:hypothetical protein Hypma_000162 [Hypsizygus marmoreus]|uniref:Uncharacterized protein n=1 Tax=Hypsizygus marmoreus TaxID=39966 RepID=A0A369KED1_HYPMA|nr:hypothetical protein Hypma_000162 [Hypsizygus marmoreus]
MLEEFNAQRNLADINEHHAMVENSKVEESEPEAQFTKESLSKGKEAAPSWAELLQRLKLKKKLDKEIHKLKADLKKSIPKKHLTSKKG